MVLLVAAFLGLAIGSLTELASGGRGRLVPALCAVVILAPAVWVLIVHYPGNEMSGLVVLFAGIAGKTLASGQLWKDHPLVSDMSYWARIGFAWSNERLLREPVTDATAEVQERSSAA